MKNEKKNILLIQEFPSNWQLTELQQDGEFTLNDLAKFV